MQVQKEGRGIDPNHSQLGTSGRSVVGTMFRLLYHWQRPDNHHQGGVMGLRAALDNVENLSPPGFDLRTVQPIVSCYANYTTPAGVLNCTSSNLPEKEYTCDNGKEFSTNVYKIFASTLT
jgi:hypothetical protein